MTTAGSGKIRYPWDDHPGPTEAVEVAEGVLWLRLPLPMALNHVNVYALDDGDGWTIVDTGVQTKTMVRIWTSLLEGPLAGKPVRRVLTTHHHPDHIGMSGWFQTNHGAEHVTSRTSYLMARMLLLDVDEVPSDAAKAYWQRAGMPEDKLRERAGKRPFNFIDVVHPLPVGYTRVKEGDTLRVGGRDWDVRMGNGHAPEHVTLWSRDDNLVLGGDQLLPSISPNVGVHPTEPEADPLGEWLESCLRLQAFARDDQLVLCGHKLPFTGLPKRMEQLIDNHHGGLTRLRKHIAEPKTAVECFPPLFKRQIDDGTYGLAMVEAMAHLNHLYVTGEATRTKRDDGALLWQSA